MAAGAADVFVYALATFLGNVGVAVTGFGMAIVYLFVWQVARLCGWEADFKHAVFIQAIGLFAAQPLLLRQANIRKHGSRNLLKLFVPVTVLSTPLGQWLGIYVDEKAVQTAGGIVICLFAAFEVFRNRGLILEALRGAPLSGPRSEDIVQSAPWMAAAREKWRDLRIEADQLLGSGALRPVGERVRHDRELYNAAQGEWKEHAIINAGQEVQYYSGATGKIDPVARSLAREAPGVILGNPAAQVVYSVLLPGSKVLPHCGPSNEVVTCHLALKVPKTAVGNNKTLGMSVGGETRQWREGEWLCFEDSFEHKVWNFGKSPRVVLLVSMLHPRRWGANGAGASQGDGSRSPAEA